mmetsp:Transcript_24000/g.61262  ORF Transcript_24000/g.61262 Transcript_24000/m.61262 type:complete len:303 (+) Transcript_24000:877-1785(+)
MSGFAWSVGAFINRAITDALYPCAAVGSREELSAKWLVCALGVLIALIGFRLLRELGQRLAAIALEATEMVDGLVETDALDGVGSFVGEASGDVGARMRDLWRKALIWLPAISFDEAMRASIGSSGASFGGWLYAVLVTFLAAWLAILIEWYVRRLLREAKASRESHSQSRESRAKASRESQEAALAHDLSNLVSNALGVIVGSAWGAYATETINPPATELSGMSTGSNWSGLLVLAVTTTACAVAYGVWLAEVFPQRQAKLIFKAPQEARRKRASMSIKEGKEMASLPPSEEAPGVPSKRV